MSSSPDAATGRRDAALALPPERFAALGHALVDRLAAELGRLRERPVATNAPAAAVRAALDAARPLPASGEDAGRLLDQAAALLFANGALAGHPRWHAYIAPAPAPIGVLAELLAAALNANVALWQAAPMASEIEAQTMRWLAELVGLAPGGGGLLTGGGSAANAIALQLALRRALPQFGDDGVAQSRVAVYASDQTHGWLSKAVQQAGLGRRALRWIASDARQRLDTDALRRALAADRAAGITPVLVVASAGTVATGAVDPLDALATLCRAEDLWLHVDGAYGAPAACLLGSADEAALGDAAPDLAALRQADSLALDPHKWLSAPIEAGGLLVREPQALLRAFGGETPSYYAAEPAHDGMDAGPSGPDFHALGPQNTRGFRALKVWLALRMAGRDGYRRIVADDIALAERLAERTRATPGLQAVTRQLSIATLRARPTALRDDPAALDALNRRLLARLQAEGGSQLSPARVDGRFLLRACIVNFQTTAADVDALPPLLARLAAMPG